MRVAGYEVDELSVTICHPFEDMLLPLSEWIARGPGSRPFLHPGQLIVEATGEKISVRRLPLRYRNTTFSRLLIVLRLLDDPWRGELGGEQP